MRAGSARRHRPQSSHPSAGRSATTAWRRARARTSSSRPPRKIGAGQLSLRRPRPTAGKVFDVVTRIAGPPCARALRRETRSAPACPASCRLRRTTAAGSRPASPSSSDSERAPRPGSQAHRSSDARREPAHPRRLAPGRAGARSGPSSSRSSPSRSSASPTAATPPGRAAGRRAAALIARQRVYLAAAGIGCCSSPSRWRHRAAPN